MSDQEHLAMSHSYPLKTTGSSAVSANTALTSTTCTPPFAPRPKQQQIEKTSANDLPVLTADECSIHEFCYYFQQVLFIAAILTGSALVVAGAIMHIQSGEWLVFVYIGALLAGVNMVLLLIQCYIRKQQKQRSRLHYANAKQRVGAVQYNSLAATKSEIHKQTFGHLNLATTVHPPVKDAPMVGTYRVHSPTESQKRAMMLMSSIPYRPSSVVSQHRPKETHPRSPSLLHRPSYKSTNSSGNVPLQLSRYERSPQDCHLPAVPPPSYDDLICIGHLPHEGTSIHLI